jgi:hypothetical protein
LHAFDRRGASAGLGFSVRGAGDVNADGYDDVIVGGAPITVFSGPTGAASEARRALQKFPGIGAPGADKILLFTKTHALPALDSNGLRVLVRLGLAKEAKSYSDHLSRRDRGPGAARETRLCVADARPRPLAPARPGALQAQHPALRRVPAGRIVPVEFVSALQGTRAST